ncbi:GH25 family lysozyme M1 (1,4-beta-N-acetylmuramidase) [Enterococcus sp. PF1-24]|uniref:GH25 family lysozyme n=1 Tax=unclassified Enterococcus TaxID=2608891 RepID=UPI002476961B|nr:MULTISPECIES: GH25 family lysozyme [unclassified Enterococcus]MDH6365187.1 GH25 family lysozyme M1 (1,4-beta-N-acetylmuramidase) [Enterococcus sp. PFB1-1]MDH6402288.1 GH25 family lysozyme M1 (1,4-beta-N-acetylmuramidase) [Enterococcus sp. PF1-24]
MKKKNVCRFLVLSTLATIGMPAVFAEATETTQEVVEIELQDNLLEGFDFYLPEEEKNSDLNPEETAVRGFLTRTDVDDVRAGEGNRPRADFIDVSSHNGNISVADYQKMMAYGVTGVIVKATEGTSYRNPNAGSQVNNALQAGLKVSVYHYAHYTSGEAANAEAEYFANYVAELGLPKTVNMVDDIEEGVMKNANLNPTTAAFTSRLNQLGYNNVYYYTSLSWLNQSSYSGPFSVDQFGAKNIWVAQYPYQPDASMNWNNGNAAWQWSSRYYVDGIAHSFDISIDYTGLFSNGVSAEAEGSVYRAYNPNNGGHLYTLNKIEHNIAINQGWHDEKVAFKAADASNGVPVYRVYNPNSGEHFLTKDANEYNHLGSLGWRQEGISFHSASGNGGKEVYRVYNPNDKSAGSHHYTNSKAEVDWLVGQGWRYEQVAFRCAD